MNAEEGQWYVPFELNSFGKGQNHEVTLGSQGKMSPGLQRKWARFPGAGYEMHSPYHVYVNWLNCMVIFISVLFQESFPWHLVTTNATIHTWLFLSTTVLFYMNNLMSCINVFLTFVSLEVLWVRLSRLKRMPLESISRKMQIIHPCLAYQCCMSPVSHGLL